VLNRPYSLHKGGWASRPYKAYLAAPVVPNCSSGGNEEHKEVGRLASWGLLVFFLFFFIYFRIQALSYLRKWLLTHALICKQRLCPAFLAACQNVLSSKWNKERKHLTYSLDPSFGYRSIQKFDPCG